MQVSTTCHARAVLYNERSSTIELPYSHFRGHSGYFSTPGRAAPLMNSVTYWSIFAPTFPVWDVVSRIDPSCLGRGLILDSFDCYFPSRGWQHLFVVFAGLVELIISPDPNCLNLPSSLYLLFAPAIANACSTLGLFVFSMVEDHVIVHFLEKADKMTTHKIRKSHSPDKPYPTFPQHGCSGLSRWS
jgi:hypothetical protein